MHLNPVFLLVNMFVSVFVSVCEQVWLCVLAAINVNMYVCMFSWQPYLISAALLHIDVHSNDPPPPLAFNTFGTPSTPSFSCDLLGFNSCDVLRTLDIGQ